MCLHRFDSPRVSSVSASLVVCSSCLLNALLAPFHSFSLLFLFHVFYERRLGLESPMSCRQGNDSDGLGTSTETLGGSVASHPEAGVLVSRRRVRKRDGKEKSPKLQNLDGLFCAFFLLIFYLFPSIETNGRKEKTEDCHSSQAGTQICTHTHTLGKGLIPCLLFSR